MKKIEKKTKKKPLTKLSLYKKFHKNPYPVKAGVLAGTSQKITYIALCCVMYVHFDAGTFRQFMVVFLC